MNTRDMRFKTTAFKEWRELVFQLIMNDTQAMEGLKRLAEQFDTGAINCFKVCVTGFYPSVEFYNKQGAISSKTFDVTNVEKPLIDIIFGGVMNVNDKNIFCLISTKEAAHQPQRTIHISVSGYLSSKFSPDESTYSTV